MMGGWKTWAAAGGSCLLGLAMIGIALMATELKEVLFGLGLQAILFGFGLVGLGHKVEKNAAADLLKQFAGTARKDKEPQA